MYKKISIETMYPFFVLTLVVVRWVLRDRRETFAEFFIELLLSTLGQPCLEWFQVEVRPTSLTFFLITMAVGLYCWARLRYQER